MPGELTRKDFLRTAVISAVAGAMPVGALAARQKPAAPDLTIDDLKSFTKMVGLTFTDAELKELLSDVKDWLAGYETVRGLPIPFDVEPPTIFTPKTTRRLFGKPGYTVKTSSPGRVEVPRSDEDLAFMSVKQLGELVRTKQLSPVRLTELYLDRLRTYGDKLLCVVTLMPEQAMQRARQAEAEIRSGHYRGPLHGIPCGIKDLFAMRGAPTTWGAEPYKEQVLDVDSAVVERLHAAGAIILAKLSMGALALGDVWFRGKTKNPWNPKTGSSGSSAGSAAATAAGLVAFGIGTETLGSICSPSNQCRVTGFRPSYGRVSKFGAMGLSYTMDKVGPICREVEDCALVFAALAGHDPRDRSSVDRPFHYRPDVKLHDLRIAYLGPQREDDAAKAIRERVTKTLEGLGARVVPIKIDPVPNGLLTVLEVEAASAFDELTRSDRIHLLKDNPWPESFRASRFVPGVEYLQAQRARAWLMDKYEHDLGDIDVIVTPGIGGITLRITNLTGHPQVIIPQGADDKGNSRSLSFVGRLYEEDKLLAVAHAFQETGNFHKLGPDLTKV